VQRLLAHVRTDLDAFSDIEADALMASGYLMTRQRLPPDAPLVRLLGGGEAGAPAPTASHPWRFAWIVPHLGKPESLPRLVPGLQVASRLVFKVAYLVPKVRRAALVLGLTLLVLAVGYVWLHQDQPIVPVVGLDHAVSGITWRKLGATLMAALVAILVGARRPLRLRLLKLGGGVFAAIAGFLVCRAYLAFGNPLFLRQGRRPHRKA